MGRTLLNSGGNFGAQTNLQPNGPPAGNGVKYVANPTLTLGDACWLLGQGAYYATSGCDHFGVSFATGIRPGVVRYHWLVPSAGQAGVLVQAPWKNTSGPMPPAAVQAYVAPAGGLPAAVDAVAEAAENQEPQWSDAVWVKTYTSLSPVPADLDQLQANVVAKKSTPTVKVSVNWALLQQPPAGEPGEKDDVQNADLPAGMALVRRYEYFHYNGLYDPETHEALCYPGPSAPGDCLSPKVYKYTDPATGLTKTIYEKGKYIGAHNEAFNPPQ